MITSDTTKAIGLYRRRSVLAISCKCTASVSVSYISKISVKFTFSTPLFYLIFGNFCNISEITNYIWMDS